MEGRVYLWVGWFHLLHGINHGGGFLWAEGVDEKLMVDEDEGRTILVANLLQIAQHLFEEREECMRPIALYAPSSPSLAREETQDTLTLEFQERTSTAVLEFRERIFTSGVAKHTTVTPPDPSHTPMASSTNPRNLRASISSLVNPCMGEGMRSLETGNLAGKRY